MLRHAAALPPMQRNFGEGRISVQAIRGKTGLKDLYQQGSAKLRLPADHGAGALEAVMINTSGGLTGGDELIWHAEAGEGTRLVMTSQACEKIYRKIEGVARSDIALKVKDQASLDWLPQETILYNRSALKRTIDADIAETASLLLCEAIVFGRQAMGEFVNEANVHDRWRVRRGGQLLHAEEFRISGDAEDLLQQRAVAAGHHAFATLLLVSPKAESLLEPVRHCVAMAGGASYWSGKLLVRLTASDSYHLRQTLIPLIKLMQNTGDLPQCWTQ